MGDENGSPLLEIRKSNMLSNADLVKLKRGLDPFKNSR